MTAPKGRTYDCTVRGGGFVAERSCPQGRSTYGFKSVKSIVKLSFVAERPKTFWEGLQASEYGFWANVNPAVSHPRWSQASERVLGTDQRVPTLIYNGYGEQVAGLYKGLENERLFV